MQHREESHSGLGVVRIHKNVIASIASIAATEIEGVKRTGAETKSGFIQEIINGSKILSSIKVDFDKNEDVKLEIPIIIKYGYSIPDVANKVQENIRNSLEKMTNLSIKDINVNVQGIERGNT